MKSIADIINGIITVEGGYVNDPKDSGGETKYGWTKKALQAEGWYGAVADLTKEEAFDLYYRRFVVRSGYREVLFVSDSVGAELVDTSVNLGEFWAGSFLQKSLNAFNNGQAHYPDIKEDGIVGRNTLKALEKFLRHRGSEGEKTLLKAMNVLQGARYIELCVKYPKNERFAYGWILNRVEV
jgi:lysozyme family protein